MTFGAVKFSGTTCNYAGIEYVNVIFYLKIFDNGNRYYGPG